MDIRLTSYISIDEAKKFQMELSDRVRCVPFRKKITYVAGVDVSIKKDKGIACVVVMDYTKLKQIDISIAKADITFPYIPGLLSFREGPVVIEAIKKLSIMPDVFIFDGQGIAHPRRIGIASHVGVLLDIPTIGCAKSVLCGEFEMPGTRKGSWTPLVYNSQIIGAILRTKTDIKPVVISIGHKIDLYTSIEIILNLCTKYRLPEPIRYAHIIAGKEIKKIDNELKDLF